MQSTEQYRPNAALLLTDGHGRVLCCERSDDTYGNVLQIVQGGIEPGEGVIEAALREASEELGIDPSIITVLGVMEKEFRYQWTMQHVYSQKYPNSPYIGQEQHYVFGQIEPGTVMTLDAHHREFHRVFWGSPQILIEGCWEAKRPGIIAALQHFGLLPWNFEKRRKIVLRKNRRSFVGIHERHMRVFDGYGNERHGD
jgi:8-oxo-dGTP pyrophosphatase MutT (NUDIX family)